MTIAWNKPSMQHDFLVKGRPQSRASAPGTAHIAMTHEEIFDRVSKFCEKYEEGSVIRTQFLFFVLGCPHCRSSRFSNKLKAFPNSFATACTGLRTDDVDVRREQRQVPHIAA